MTATTDRKQAAICKIAPWSSAVIVAWRCPSMLDIAKGMGCKQDKYSTQIALQASQTLGMLGRMSLSGKDQDACQVVQQRSICPALHQVGLLSMRTAQHIDKTR